MKQKMKLIGEVKLALYDKDGKLKAYRVAKNMTVTVGFETVCDQVGKATGQPVGFGWCAVGNGTTDPVLSNTLLEGELGRVSGGYARTASTIWRNKSTFGAGVATGAITESGLFNASGADAPTMLCRQVFAVINKGANDVLEVTWQYTLSG